MKNLKHLVTVALIIMLSLNSFSQGVGINNDESDADPSAMLDVKSTTKGILVPRMNSSQRTAIASPANGLLVYDLSTESLWFYQNGTWAELRAGNISEISDTDGDTKIDVEAAADEDKIRFYPKGVNSFTMDSMRIETADNSIFIGRGAGGLISNRNNIGMGDSALFHNGEGAMYVEEATMNVAIGTKALFSNTMGSQNLAIGDSALHNNTYGDANIAIGISALNYGRYNSGIVAIGFGALQYNTVGYGHDWDGIWNTAIGTVALGSNTVGLENTATGLAALHYNTIGSYNTANGCKALYENTVGECNSAFGDGTLNFNATGSYNNAFGYDALYSNNSGHSNVAIGAKTLKENTTQSNLVAIGDSALYHNGEGATSSTQAIGNTAVGSKSLYSNKTGFRNTGLGYQSLYYTVDGNDNTGFGFLALHNLFDGSNNTAIGSYVWPTGSATYSNYTGIGYLVGTNTANPSNRVEIGNSSVGWIGGQVIWSTYSDKRIKENIKSDVPGLDFINRLKPVTYNLNIHKQNEMMGVDKAKGNSDWEGKYDIEKRKMTGFVAQEVAEAAREANYDFSGVDIPENENELYSLRYAEFVVPLVKAVQELAEENRKLKERIEKLETKGK